MHLFPFIECCCWRRVCGWRVCLLAAKVPTPSQVSLLQRCLYEMCLSASGGASQQEKGPLSADSYAEERFYRVPSVVSSVLGALPDDGHPMTSLTAAAAALSDFSFFKAATEQGLVGKRDLWKAAMPDALTLVSGRCCC